MSASTEQAVASVLIVPPIVQDDGSDPRVELHQVEGEGDTEVGVDIVLELSSVTTAAEECREFLPMLFDDR